MTETTDLTYPNDTDLDFGADIPIRIVAGNPRIETFKHMPTSAFAETSINFWEGTVYIPVLVEGVASEIGLETEASIRNELVTLDASFDFKAWSLFRRYVPDNL